MQQITIGRSKENDIVLTDVSVSRNHASILVNDNNTFQIIDNNSTNGTYVNGNRVYGTKNLNYNDIVKLGNAVVPWRNYINNNQKSNHSSERFESAPKIQYSTPPNYPINQKKSNTGVIILFVLIISVGLSLGYYFLIYKTDAKKIVGRWRCIDNCSGLNELVFDDRYHENTVELKYKEVLEIGIKGNWTINENRKKLKLIIESTEEEAEYDYEFRGNKLILDEINDEDGPVEFIEVK